MRLFFNKALLDTARDYYAQPHRGYHDTGHFDELIALARLYTPDLNEAEQLALLFHDAVYVPGAADGENERQSAELMRACAARLGIVGVDLERNWPQSEPVWHVLHVNERRTLEAQWREKKSDGDFLQIWMAKEAWLKAVGAGLKRDPAGIEIVVSPNGVFEVLDPQWRGGKIVGLHDALFIGDELLPVACVSTKRLPSRGRYSY
mgnify:CR=1 FL=1